MSFAAQYGYALSIAGTLTSRLAMLAVLILLPKQIGLTDYGLFVLIVTLGEIIEMTCSNWYRLLLVRQSVNEAPPASTRRGISIFTIVCAAALLTVAAAFAISPAVASEGGGHFAGSVAAYVLAFGLFRLQVTLLQAQGRQNLIGAIELTRGILSFALVMLAVHLIEASFTWAAFALVAATLMSIVIGLPALRGNSLALLRQRLEPGSFVTIGVPIIIATALTYQLGWLDRLVIQHWMGPQHVGLYVAVIAVARQPIDLVLNALNTQTFPVMMQRGDGSAESQRRIAGVLAGICIMGFGAAASIIALAGPLIRFALPVFDTATATALVPFIAAGSLALGIKHFVFDNIFHAHGRNWTMLSWFALIACGTLAANIVVVPIYGPLGAAAAFTVGALAGLLSSAILSRQMAPIRMPWNTLARAALAAALAGLAAWAVSKFDVQPWLQIVSGLSAFAAVYVAGLALLLDFRLAAFLAAPWKIDVMRGSAP